MRSKEEIEIYGDIVYNHKLSIRTIIREFFLRIFAKRYRVKETIYHEQAMFPSIVESSDIRYIAIVNDGVVEEMIRLKKPVAEILLKSKSKLIPYNPQEVIVKKGMLYKNKAFIKNIKEEEKDV